MNMPANASPRTPVPGVSSVGTHDCDLCGSVRHTVLEVARPHIGDEAPPVVCRNCGFVYVRRRRSAKEVIAWWKHAYEAKIYDPTLPGVRARLFYVAEWIDQNRRLKGARVLDFGSGDGFFVEECRRRGADATGYEPSRDQAQSIPTDKYDIVTILWTLENTTDCLGVLTAARKLLGTAGGVVVATGSRILVPYKKPLSRYFSTNPADTHCFRWTAQSLSAAFRRVGLLAEHANDWNQNDVLLISGGDPAPGHLSRGMSSAGSPMPSSGEHDAVTGYFDRWAKEWP